MLVERGARLSVHVAGGNRDGLDTLGVTSLRDIHCVFYEDNRVVVGEGDRLAPVLSSGIGDGVGGSGLGQAVGFTGFTDVPVLAKAAAQVAAGGSKGKNAGAWIKMIERLLLHGIDAKAAAAPISGQDKTVIDSLAHKTKAALPLMEFTYARADPAFEAPIRKHRPPIRLVVGNNHWLKHKPGKFSTNVAGICESKRIATP